MKGFLRTCGMAALGLLVATTVHAAPILVVSAGAITGTVFVPSDGVTPPTYDVRGTASGAVTEQTTSENLGTAVLNGSAPPPSSDLTLGSTTLAEALDLLFNFSGSSGLGSFDWFIPVTGTALSPSVTDLALIGFVGGDAAHFANPVITAILGGDNETQVATLLQYQLVSLSGTGAPVTGQQVPEPASLCLVGSGLLMAYRRRQSNKNRA